MTRLIRGELIKATTTRTIFAYARSRPSRWRSRRSRVDRRWRGATWMSLADKTEAIAGLPLLVLLLGLVGAAGEYRHRTAAPAALVAGRDRGPAVRRGRAPTLRGGRGGRARDGG